MGNPVYAGSGRLFVIPFGAGPKSIPEFVDNAAAGEPDWGQGDVTKVESPSDRRYNNWTPFGEFQAAPDRATVTLTRHVSTDFSRLDELRRLRCAFDAQIHIGACGEDPKDFNSGWDKINVFPFSYVTSYKPGIQGALQSDSQAIVDQEVDISSREIYTIQQMNYSEIAGAAVKEEVVAVQVCGGIDCGDCATFGSDGRQRIFALTNPKTTSPGLKPQVVATGNAFATTVTRFVTTYALGEEASDGTCTGSYYTAISQDGLALHYALLQNILDSNETWAKVTTGFVAAKGPNAIWNYSSILSIIVGNGGYIYKMEDPASGVTVLDAGSATTQNLNDVDGYNARIIVAVGAANAVVYTVDGGATWAAVTGPAPAVILTAVDLRNEDEWWVGDANGALWYTIDKGAHWYQMAGLKGTPTRVEVLHWTDKPGVGYVATTHAGPAGKIQRTIDGGHSWYIVPETGSALPANDAIYAIDMPDDEVNVIYAGGLADNGGDGILIRGIHAIV